MLEFELNHSFNMIFSFEEVMSGSEERESKQNITSSDKRRTSIEDYYS